MKRTEFDAEFIYRRVATDLETGCWNWIGSVNKISGRPVFNGQYAYRISYRVFVGPIPEGLQINHHCDNPRCVNPEHIYAGTQEQNIADAVVRGRNYVPEAPHGEAQHNAYPDAMVDAVRVKYAAGGVTQVQLANEFGVSLSAVENWVRGYQRGRERIVREPASCGTRAAYCAHLKRKEPRCGPCLQANRQYMTAWKTARSTRLERAA